GDLTSSGAAIANFPTTNNFLSINSSGQVSFLAAAGPGSGVPGIYVGSPGGVAAKVAAVGDAAPSGGTFSIFPSPSLNDSGEVAFIAGVNGGPAGGVFVGSTSTPPVALAVNGDAAPSGGNFAFTNVRPDVAINNQHDVAFRSSLTGGTADSGYFIRRGAAGAL